MLYSEIIAVCSQIHTLLSIHTFKQISERNAKHFLPALNIHILSYRQKNSTRINWQEFNCDVKQAQYVEISEHSWR